MNDIILSTQNGQAVVSSLDIAKNFEKRHDSVMRAIEDIVEGLHKNVDTPMFYKTEYVHEQNGQKYPMYLMNRDGFTLLVMGFNKSAKAMEWKLKYIQAFNEMEKQLAQRPQLTNGNSLQALNLLVKSLNEQQDAMNRLQVNVDAQSAAIEKLEDRTELMQQAFALDLNDWRKNAKSVVGSIVLKKTGGDIKDNQPIWEETWNEVYDRMDSKFHRKMKQRLENLRKRTGNKKLNMLDAIDRADNGDRARLISELNTVLTEMCIYYGVRLNMDKAKNLTNRHEDSQISLFDRNCAPAGKLMDAREAAARG